MLKILALCVVAAGLYSLISAALALILGKCVLWPKCPDCRRK